MTKNSINERIWQRTFLLKSDAFASNLVRERLQLQIAAKTRTAIRQRVVLPISRFVFNESEENHNAASKWHDFG